MNAHDPAMAFLMACSEKNEQQAISAFEHGLDPNDATPAGESLLDAAIRHSMEALARTLLILGANPWAQSDIYDDDGNRLRAPPFEAALLRGMSEFCRECLSDAKREWLVEREALWAAEMSARTSKSCRGGKAGSGWLHLAAIGDSPELLIKLYQSGISPRLDSAGLDHLMACAIAGSSLPTAIAACRTGGTVSIAPGAYPSPLDFFPFLYEECAKSEAEDIFESLPTAMNDSKTGSL